MIAPYFAEDDLVLYQGDVMAVLKELPDESVDCVCTSPPYWSLRDYGTGEWLGGDTDCDHARPTTNYNRDFNERWGQGSGERKQEQKSNGQYADVCPKCGAQRVDQQLGLEPTPTEYVQKIVEIFREVRRVLVSNGTVWLNLGDTYAANRSYQVPDSKYERMRQNRGSMGLVDGLKPKDLTGIPWRTALALQDDGWWLRSDIIWAKPNAMPGSYKDRPTTAHEYIFLLAKSQTYFFNMEAVLEPAEWARWGDQTSPKYRDLENGKRPAGAWVPDRSREELQAMAERGRHMRDVWTIVTQPYPEAHFAVFPEEIPNRCILAGCPEGGVVLDPFAGSCTTLVVARRLKRKSIGIDLNAEYLDLGRKRLSQWWKQPPKPQAAPEDQMAIFSESEK